VAGRDRLPARRAAMARGAAAERARRGLLLLVAIVAAFLLL
jgi:hypothetical protein